jgi:hypothetical protein
LVYNLTLPHKDWGSSGNKPVLISQVHFWEFLRVKRREWPASYSLLRPLFWGVKNKLLDTAPDFWAGLKIMTQPLRFPRWYVANILPVFNWTRTAIGSDIRLLWSRPIVELLVSVSSSGRSQNQ